MAVNELGPIGGKGGLGPFGEMFRGDKTAGILGITNIVSSIIGMLTVVASIWFLLQILFAGYEWMSAGGDTKKIASARDRITHAFTGLLIVIGAWSLVAVTGQFFGFNTLVNPGEVIENLSLPGGN